MSPTSRLGSPCVGTQEDGREATGYRFPVDAVLKTILYPIILSPCGVSQQYSYFSIVVV